MSTQIISILILIFVIILFVSQILPSPVTAILGCALFAVFNICTIEEAFSGFSNSIVLFVFGMIIVGTAMSQTGLADLIGKKVITLSKHNEKLFIIIAGTTAFVLSSFFSNTAIIAIFLPVIDEMSKSDPNMNRMNMTLPVALGAIYGGVTTLVGSTTPLIGNGILSELAGEELKMFDYTLPGIILFIVMMFYVIFIGYPLGKKIWENRDAVSDDDDEIKDQQPSDDPRAQQRKMIMTALIFAGIIVSFIGGWIDIALTAVLGGILCLITGCVSFKTVIQKMEWSMIFVLAGCLGISTGITKGGVAELLGDAITKMIGNNVPPMIIFAFFIVLTMLVSNLLMNASTVIIILPIALSLCLKQGLNPALFTMGIVFAASLAYSTPLANAYVAQTLVAGYRFTDYFRYTWILNILVLLTMIIVFPLLMPLTV